MKNVRIKESTNQRIEHAEGYGKWLLILFLALAWFTKSEAIEVHKWPVAAVGNHAAMSRCEAANICVLGWTIL